MIDQGIDEYVLIGENMQQFQEIFILIICNAVIEHGLYNPKRVFVLYTSEDALILQHKSDDFRVIGKILMVEIIRRDGEAWPWGTD